MKIVKRAKIKQGVTGSDPLWVANLMRGLIPFDSQGAMRARRFDGLEAYTDSLGRLEWADEIVPIYMVWSYATPIGWVDDRGKIVVPAVKYGVTTSNHQRLVSAFMGQGACRHAPGCSTDLEDGYTMANCGPWEAIGGDWV